MLHTTHQLTESGFTYFEHSSGTGIVGRGASIEAAFEAAAQGMFAIMVDLATVEPHITIRFHFKEVNAELALVAWLERLLAEARADHLALSRFQLRREESIWFAECSGEPWWTGLARRADVKGVKHEMLSVTRGDRGWEAQCVVDVPPDSSTISPSAGGP